MYSAAGLAAFVAVLCGVTSNPVLNSRGSIVSDADTAPSCPAGYSMPANSGWTSCYKIYSSFKTKKAAAHQCKADNGSLASVHNSFVNSYIYYTASQSRATSVWLGIECINGETNDCVNDDGTSYAFNNFYPGQPNVDGVCVYLSAIGRDSQKWLTFDCEQKFQFACEVAAADNTVSTTMKPAVPSTATTPTTQAPEPTMTHFCPDGYSYFQGMCYRKFDDPGDIGLNTHDQQSAQCKLIPGGNLATIPNAAVQQFADTLECGNDYYRIGLSCPNVAYVGDTRSCLWDDGKPLSFSNFAGGAPQAANPTPCIYSYKGLWYNDGNAGCDVSFECSLCEAPAL